MRDWLEVWQVDAAVDDGGAAGLNILFRYGEMANLMTLSVQKLHPGGRVRKNEQNSLMPTSIRSRCTSNLPILFTSAKTRMRLEKGNFIDTANNQYAFRVVRFYFATDKLVFDPSQDETSEEFIGEWAEKRGIRDQLIIATKASPDFSPIEPSQKVLMS